MHEPEMDYSTAQVKGLIKRYRELRSAVQVVAMHHNQPAGGTGGLSGREDIICMLVDIEQAASSLTKRQQQVILLMISGYSNEDISRYSGL
jgi:DNA-binding NarL/FixJ family response regulator